MQCIKVIVAEHFSLETDPAAGASLPSPGRNLTPERSRTRFNVRHNTSLGRMTPSCKEFRQGVKYPEVRALVLKLLLSRELRDVSFSSPRRSVGILYKRDGSRKRSRRASGN